MADMRARFGLYIHLKIENLVRLKPFYQCQNSECGAKRTAFAKFCSDCGSAMTQRMERTKALDFRPSEILPPELDSEIVEGHDMIGGPIWLVDLDYDDYSVKRAFPHLGANENESHCPVTIEKLLALKLRGEHNEELNAILDYLNTVCGAGTAELLVGMTADWS